MPLRIETFSNVSGGNAFFKALTHPLAAEKAQELFRTLEAKGPVAIYDPLNLADMLGQAYGIAELELGGYYVQDVEYERRVFAEHAAKLITALPDSKASSLFIIAFDASRLADQIKHLLKPGIMVHSLDALRLPDPMLSDRARYLAPLNFATNFVFFRDAKGDHTRLVTANYWGAYGAKNVRFWCRLYDEAGRELAQWEERAGAPNSALLIDSREIRTRFGLPEFTGQLFIHATGIAGHDVVKYALDTYGDSSEVLSCTHDANSWPADFYAGLPAPDVDEDVVLWVQNSQPFEIPAGEITLNVMGHDTAVPLPAPLGPFATRRLSVSEMLPQARWPQQVEIAAGKYAVRPRYEVFSKSGRSRIAHVNVERTDLKPDPKLAQLGRVLGKGHILPAPVLPLNRFDSFILPTPMVRGVEHFPLKAVIYDATGALAAEHRFGNLPRDHASLLDVSGLLAEKRKALPSGYGHVELTYDFEAGEEADGWMHGLFRYRDRESGHSAESSFGSHMFNSVLVYKNEPQSYSGRAPGLTTRLFLRLGQKPYDTLCHLIYPASAPWLPKSDTALILTSNNGEEIARAHTAIACNGSYHWRVSETFERKALEAAGEGSYVTIRDTTCRLFGYHGLVSGETAFSLDHMFGF
ncbi:MAG: hypothetical protein ACLPJY_16010 [Rhodomicrobium sp.]